MTRSSSAAKGRAATLRPEQAIALAAATVLLASAGSGPAAAQQPRASVMIVLDGSNSMNGPLGRERAPKLTIARDALRAALARSTPGTELGLAVFGGRNPNTCNDVEILAPLSSDPGRVTAALERYQPRGLSPVVLAMRAAAKALPGGETKASIVLVLDDLASCRGEDPCAVASELKRQSPALSIHVVGLALRPSDQPAMACVARQTGGKLIDAQDAKGAMAAIEEVLTAAYADRPPTPAVPVPVPVPVAATPPRPPTRAVATANPVADLELNATAPGLHLAARLAEGRPPIAATIDWRVSREGDAAAEAAVAEASAPSLSRQLPTGRYVVEARAGLVTARQAVEITTQGPTTVIVNLDAAALAIAAVLTPGGAAAGRATLSVMPAGAGAARQGSISRTGSATLIVPAGSYRVVAEDGLVRAEETAAVTAGTQRRIELTLNAGRLAVDAGAAAAAAAGPGQAAAERTQFIVEEDDTESSSGRREIARLVAPRLDIALPAGSYHVTARRGTAEVRERIAVRAGEETTRTLPLTAVRVRLVSRIGSGLPAGLAVSYRVERLDGAPRVITRGGDAETTVELAPGRYRFESRIGAQNAVAVREAEIRAGADQRIDMDTGAGGVRLRVAGLAGGLQFGEVFWQIYDDQNRPVWRTAQAEPVLALVAGRYRARADVRDRALERTFDVRAGDSRTIDVGN